MRITRTFNKKHGAIATKPILSSRNFLSVFFAAGLVFSNNSFAENYTIDSGPLGKTLSKIATDAGLAFSFEPSLTKNLTSSAVSGDYSVLEVMKKIAAGSDLEIIQRKDGSYTLVRAAKTDTKSEVTSLSTIMVKGEKFERSVQETLSSVVVVTGKNIEENSDQTLTDVLLRTPGVYSQSGSDSWGIRGVPSTGFDDQGPVTINSAVAVYLDGVIQPQSLVINNPLPLWDMGQIEIFRGPQSTVQGRNALAGAIIMQTNNPSYEPEFAVEANLGNYGQSGISYLAGGELVEGKVAGRITVDYQEIDGYINNDILNTDSFSQRNFNIRGKLLVQPTNDLDMLFTVARSEHSRGENAVTAENGQPNYYSISYNTDANSSNKLNTVSAKIDYYINDRWSLVSLTSASSSDYHSLLDFDQGAIATQEAKREHEQKGYNQEFRLAFDSDNLRAHVGLYLNKLTLTTDDQVSFGNLILLKSQGDSDVKAQALFGEVNWDFTDRWQLITGLRYDREQNDTEINYLTDLLGLAPQPSTRISQDFNALLPKVGLKYELAAEHLLGFVVQRGYRSGGINLRPAAAHESYDPEFTTNYELSYRGSWLDERLTTNANVYYTKWKDQQIRVVDNNNGFLRVVNAASSEMHGAELSAGFEVNKSLSLLMSAAYNDTEYNDFTSDNGDLSGQSFLYAPEYKVHLGATYKNGNKFMANLNATYQSDSPSAYLTNGAGQVTGTRYSDNVILVNSTLSYKVSKNIRVSAYVKNIFDQRYISNNQNDDLLDVGEPRIFGFKLNVSL